MVLLLCYGGKKSHCSLRTLERNPKLYLSEVLKYLEHTLVFIRAEEIHHLKCPLILLKWEDILEFIDFSMNRCSDAGRGMCLSICVEMVHSVM